jgi:hypothetical protein
MLKIIHNACQEVCKLYYYKFIGNNSKPSETVISDSCPDGFISFNGEVDWTTKRLVNGKLEDIPKSIQKYCYSNNGFNVSRVTMPYTTQSGEILFDNQPTPAELSAAFPLYTTIIKQQNIDTLNSEYQQKKEKLNARHSSFILSTSDEAKVATRTTQLRTEYAALLTELKIKQGVIVNG